MKKLTVYIIIILIHAFLYHGYAYAKERCFPDDLQIKALPSNNKTSSNNEKNPVFVFFDGSLSMEGFVVNQPGQKNKYKELIFDLTNVAENVGSKTLYHRFGKTIQAIDEAEVSRVITPDFYRCPKGAAKCALDNQETRLDMPFRAWKRNKEATYIITTDLFMSQKRLLAGARQQLVRPLKDILKSGKSIGIMGIMSSFNGVIYDIPLSASGTTTYSKAQQRPFYIIIIGDQKNIHKIKTTIVQEHFIDPGDKYKFSLITSNPISNNLNATKKINQNNIPSIIENVGFKFEYLESNLAFYQFDITKGASPKLEISNSEFIVQGSNPIGEYELEENLWSSQEIKCKNIKKDNTWKKAKFNEIGDWEQTDNKLIINLYKKKSLEKFFWGKRYFHHINIYASQPGKQIEEKFKDWSLEEHEAEEFKNGNPVEFKTLNLVSILKILNAVANEVFEPKLIASIALDFNVVK